jgi:hypothetical protein
MSSVLSFVVFRLSLGKSPATIVDIDAKGGYLERLEAVLKFLRRSSGKCILVGRINEATALGALRALQVSAMPEDCESWDRVPLRQDERCWANRVAG